MVCDVHGCLYSANDWYMYKTTDVVHKLYLRNLNLYKLQQKNVKIVIHKKITRTSNPSYSKLQLLIPNKQESTTAAAATANRVVVEGSINCICHYLKAYANEMMNP